MSEKQVPVNPVPQKQQQPVKKVVVVKQKRRSKRLILLLTIILLLLLFSGWGLLTGTSFLPYFGLGTSQPTATTAAKSGGADEAFFTITIRANTLEVDGKALTPPEIVEQAKNSGRKIKLVYGRDARTPIEEQILKALEEAGLHASMVIK